MARRNIKIKWKYNIGDNIVDENRNLTITDRYVTEHTYLKNNKEYVANIKHYKYICNICGFNDGDVLEGNLCNKKSGCSCCGGRTAVKGINDISTIRPDLIKYFIDINDAYTHTIYSEDKVCVKCPICGFEKQIIIHNLTRSGLGCNRCSDGISYPEKFIMSVLNQLHIKYITQYRIDGYKYKYDFYLTDFNTIIETNGEQHYTNTFMRVNIEDIKTNDLNKKNVALQNNIDNYIELNCSKSEMDYIKNSIYKNEFLNRILDLNNIDWNLCHREALKNKLIEICAYWKENSDNTNVDDVSKEFNISRTTILKYLHIGTDIGLCNYDAKLEIKKGAKKKMSSNNHMARSVVQLTKDMKFIKKWECINDAARNVGASYGMNITKCCKGEIHSAYGFVWMYYKEYLDKLEAQKNGSDMFGGLLNDSKNDVVTSQDICNNNTDDIDLSWLDELA